MMKGKVLEPYPTDEARALLVHLLRNKYPRLAVSIEQWIDEMFVEYASQEGSTQVSDFPAFMREIIGDAQIMDDHTGKETQRPRLFGREQWHIGPLMFRRDLYPGHVLNFYWRGTWRLSFGTRHFILNGRYGCRIWHWGSGRLLRIRKVYDEPFDGRIIRT